ncbi:pentatricopeptide repeat-containing protein At2g02750 [Nymphaea colorata]|uniref:Pentacotripeptide-repeat region of PRORP domain-containing protein n=1 Tax=Nymphaea colorata TaxID=210225 RepID=A0A5K0ZE79_9MAGN|nr:pentatricopeptide repeat-containing protein At2g02750 [Nymphaea colorata]
MKAMKMNRRMSLNPLRVLVSKGHYREALSLYAHSGIQSPHEAFSFPFLLKACAKLPALSDGQKLHAHILKTGFHDAYTTTSLISMYAEVGLISDAHQVLDETSTRSLECFNALVSGLVQNGSFGDALLSFKWIQGNGLQPNSVSIASLLPACSRKGTRQQGLQLHAFSVKCGFELDLFVGSGILTMYANFGDLSSSVRIFNSIPEKNAVCYNALLSGFLHGGFPRKVLEIVQQMQRDGQTPSSVTLVSLLSACSDLSELQYGKQAHSYIMRSSHGIDLLTGTALIDMYSKCRSLREAHHIFKSMPEKSLFTWNAMISATSQLGHYESAVELFQQMQTTGLEPDVSTWNSIIGGPAKQGLGFEALRLFKEMQLSGIEPNVVSMTSMLTVCSSLSDLQRGREIHGYIIKSGLHVDVFLETALIDMYAKCGWHAQARRVFDGRHGHGDTVLWNAMIGAYGRNGDSGSALKMLDCMEKENITPNSATFTSVLSVCSHTGLIDRGWKIFTRMRKKFLIEPCIEHYTCMVDLFSRAGKLDEARRLLKEMPMYPSASMLATVLGACSRQLDADLGEEIARELLRLEPENPAAFVVLSNIYAEQERWVDVERLRELMRNRGMKKSQALSTVCEPLISTS